MGMWGNALTLTLSRRERELSLGYFHNNDGWGTTKV